MKWIILGFILLPSFVMGMENMEDKDNEIPGVFETWFKYMYVIIPVFIVAILYFFRRVLFGMISRITGKTKEKVR